MVPSPFEGNGTLVVGRLWLFVCGLGLFFFFCAGDLQSLCALQKMGFCRWPFSPVGLAVTGVGFSWYGKGTGLVGVHKEGYGVSTGVCASLRRPSHKFHRMQNPIESKIPAHFMGGGEKKGLCGRGAFPPLPMEKMLLIYL